MGAREILRRRVSKYLMKYSNTPGRGDGVPTDVLDPLTLTFAALADPTRRAMLARLAMGRRP